MEASVSEKKDNTAAAPANYSRFCMSVLALVANLSFQVMNCLLHVQPELCIQMTDPRLVSLWQYKLGPN